jgi:hypothetical protein
MASAGDEGVTQLRSAAKGPVGIVRAVALQVLEEAGEATP